MNILIINLSLRPESPKKIFPIGLGYIATAIKNAGFKFDLLDIDAYRYSDREVESLIGRKKYDVVCLGCIVTGYKIIKALSVKIKKIHPGCIIIAGNSVATSITGTLLTRTKIDIAVMGEGDETIIDLLKAVECAGPLGDVRGISFKKNGQIIETQPRPLINDISLLPFVDFSIFDTEIYIDSSKQIVSEPLPLPRKDVRGLQVNTARGCVANCSFCYHVFKGKKYRYRSAESIVAEIKELIKKYSLNYFFFVDELTFFSKRQTLELSQKILDAKLHFYWIGDCRADLFRADDDIWIIEKMKESGCVGVGYSLESADDSILMAMNKHITVEQFTKQTQLFHKAGIATWTSLVFGYPQETPDTIRRTFDCCIKNRIYPSVGYFLPQPGSQMYEYAVKHGFIREEEEYLLAMGDRQDLRINLTQMSNAEFEASVLNGLKRCNKEMGVGLKEEELIKTQYYRGKAYANVQGTNNQV